ncbi:hypothetical protein PHYPSEUDO_003442 [Phytophthora pseudosyringae]|uniref:Uncharacterized protein n=1 Tax=Phytophthora pseudosyringae TaxID=221518 RepID=A0A8T1WCK7_9STRA|nr:hypothetical protein PHYPSEUDO_003442 [Phytophthora pseudosyringae]
MCKVVVLIVSHLNGSINVKKRKNLAKPVVMVALVVLGNAKSKNLVLIVTNCEVVTLVTVLIIRSAVAVVVGQKWTISQSRDDEVDGNTRLALAAGADNAAGVAHVGGGAGREKQRQRSGGRGDGGDGARSNNDGHEPDAGVDHTGSDTHLAAAPLLPRSPVAYVDSLVAYILTRTKWMMTKKLAPLFSKWELPTLWAVFVNES